MAEEKQRRAQLVRPRTVLSEQLDSHAARQPQARALDGSAPKTSHGLRINYEDIRELAVSGYSEPLEPGIILPFGLEQRFFSKEDAQKYGTRFDPEQAKAELRAGGYTPVFGPDGQLVETRDSGGKRLPTLYVKSPTGWSDWESIVRIAVKSMRAVGIDARERFVDTSLFWNALYEGDFDLIMHTPSTQPSPSKPWSRFEALLTSQDFAPLGQRMYKNIGRFNDPHAPGYLPLIDELLARIPSLTDDAARLAAYRELNVLFMQEQPDLPLVYRPDTFYEFSIKHWTNLPSAANPYLPPLIPGDRLGTNMLWRDRARVELRRAEGLRHVQESPHARAHRQPRWLVHADFSGRHHHQLLFATPG